MGNHEEVFLRALEGDLRALRFLIRIGGRETLLSYGISEEEYRSLDFEDAGGACARAGAAPNMSRFLSALREDGSRSATICSSMPACGPGVALEEQATQRPVLDPRRFPRPPRQLRQDGRPRPQHHRGRRRPAQPDRHRYRRLRQRPADRDRPRGRRALVPVDLRRRSPAQRGRNRGTRHGPAARARRIAAISASNSAIRRRQLRMGRAAEDVEPAPAEARPEAHRRLGIVAGAIEQIDAEPVRLGLGLADQPGIAAEIAEEAARDARLVEPRRDGAGHCGRIRARAPPPAPRRRATYSAIAWSPARSGRPPGVEPPRQDQLEAAGAALLGRRRRRVSGSPPRRIASSARPSAKARVERRRGSAPSARTAAAPRPACRAAAAHRRRPSRTSSARSPAALRRPAGRQRQHAGPGDRGRRPESPPRGESAPYCERS